MTHETYETYESLEEIRRIKAECSRERLARTPEEDRRHLDEVMKWAEQALGRPIKIASRPKRSRVADGEPAQV
jgi:hypothetical protein